MLTKIILDPITKRFIDTGEPTPTLLKLRVGRKGRPHSEEAKEKNRLAHLGEKNNMWGKHLSDEARAKISSAMKGRRSHRLGKTLPIKTRRKMSLAKRGEKHNMFGKHQSKEALRKNRESNQANFRDPEFTRRYIERYKRKPNNAEVRLQGILNKYYPNAYKYVGDCQVCIGGKFPGFINVNGRKEVIELFGEYWHNPDIFPSKLNQEDLINHYKEYGFSCVVIWEEELSSEEQVARHISRNETYPPSHSRETNWSVKPITYNPITKKFNQVNSLMEV